MNENMYVKIIKSLRLSIDSGWRLAEISRQTGQSSEWISYFAKNTIKDAGWYKVFCIYKWLDKNNLYKD